MRIYCCSLDHIFNPDGIDTDREGNPVRAELTDKQNKADLNKSKDEDEQLAQLIIEIRSFILEQKASIS